MNPNKLGLLIAACAVVLAASLHAQTPVFIPSGEPIEVAPSSFGNKERQPRAQLQLQNNP